MAEAQQAHTHTHTIVGVFPLEGKVSLPPTHLFSLFFHPSCHPPFLPLDLSFSFIPYFFLWHKQPLLLLKGGRKSVKDTEELANNS